MVGVRKIAEGDLKGVKVQKNLNIAQSLFGIIFETLHENFADRAAISWEEISKIQKKLEETWPHVESLFDNTCAQCLDTRWYVRDERRKDALTRLVFARLVMAIPERQLPGGAFFPRVLVGGLQTNIAVMLTNKEWRILNDHARFIFQYLGGDDDTMLSTQMKVNPAINLLCQRIFLTLLLRFKGFNNRRQEFVRLINNAVSESSYRMTDAEFCEVFEALFRDYHDLIQSEDGRLRLILSHAEDFPDRIGAIFNAFLRFRSGVAMINKFVVGPHVK